MRKPNTRIGTAKRKKILALHAQGIKNAVIARMVKRSWSGVYECIHPEIAEKRKLAGVKDYRRKKKLHELTPAERKRRLEINRIWRMKNIKKIRRRTRKNMIKYRKIKKEKLAAEKLEYNKVLLVEIGKKLGLYENHR